MRSFFIDTVFVISNTISFLMNQGLQYENNTLFMSTVRNVRMQGVSGIISYDVLSNNRNLYYFNLYNFYQDNVTEK